MSEVNKRKNEIDKKSEGMKKECNGVDNKLLNNFWINKLVKFIINIILVLLIYLVVGIEFGYFEAIYCEPTDSESSNNVDNNKDNKNENKNDNKNDNNNDNKDVKGKGKEKEKKEDDYNISANIPKGVIKETVEGISNVVPPLVGGLVGGKLGAAVIKASNSLPPVPKALLGVGTAIMGAGGVTYITAAVKDLTKNNSSVNTPSINNKPSIGDSNKDDFIASVLESGEELSPLHNLINHEIVFSILIFGHIGILLLI